MVVLKNHSKQHVRYFYFKDRDEFKQTKLCYHYKIADSLYQSNNKIEALEYLTQAHNLDCGHSNHLSKQFKNPKQTYKNVAIIGENRYALKVLNVSQSGYELQLENNNYRINTESIIANSLDVDINILLGPALILNLALNNIFCLHASVFTINDTTFILMADSGTGKSTIARYVDNQFIGKRIGDDIIPLKANESGLTILPSFPQLKLSQQQQYKGNNINGEIVLLFASKTKQATSMKAIDTFTGMKRLIKHSVATKLFAQDELKNHLDFCHKVSQHTNSYLLKYQHTEKGLQRLMELIDEIC